jgi:hypothetical protein
MSPRALLPVVALLLAACSSAADATSTAPAVTSTEPPPGCERTLCDAEYDACKASEVDHCSACNDTCNGVMYEYMVQCLEACGRICSAPSSTASACTSQREGCATAQRNTVCIDGVDARDVPAAPTWTHQPRPAEKPHQGACTSDELDTFTSACLVGSTTSCRAFAEGHRTCTACISSGAADASWGPLVLDDHGRSWLNSEGCIAAVSGDDACAKTIYGANTCLSACDGAKNAEVCRQLALAGSCKDVVADAESCAARLGVGTDPAFAACGGAVGNASVESMASVIAFFCGN